MSQHYKCSECGHIFEEDEAGANTYWEGEGVMRGSYDLMCCPKCKSEDYEEAEECAICGEYHAKDSEMIFDEEYYCIECVESLAATLAKTFGLAPHIMKAKKEHDDRIEKMIASNYNYLPAERIAKIRRAYNV